MRRIRDILHSRDGESLVEVIVAFVVVTVAIAAFSAFAISGSHLTAATSQSDLDTGSKMASRGTGTVHIDGNGVNQDAPVDIYGNAGDVYSYKLHSNK